MGRLGRSIALVPDLRWPWTRHPELHVGVPRFPPEWICITIIDELAHDTRHTFGCDTRRAEATSLRNRARRSGSVAM